MTEMVERAARAICELRCLRTERLQHECGGGLCRATREQLWNSWRWAAARAVITVIREPTAARLVYLALQTDKRLPPRTRLSAGQEWREMIDALLEDDADDASG